MHVLRIILGLFSAAEYLDIPSSMFFALLGGVNDRVLHSQIRDKLPMSETLNDGNSILSIIQNAKYVRFTELPNPFIEALQFDFSDPTVTAALCSEFEWAVQRSVLPDKFPGPSQGISLSDTIFCTYGGGHDKWLDFLQHFRENGGLTKSVHMRERAKNFFRMISMRPLEPCPCFTLI
jgi:hypothetical protein